MVETGERCFACMLGGAGRPRPVHGHRPHGGAGAGGRRAHRTGARRHRRRAPRGAAVILHLLPAWLSETMGADDDYLPATYAADGFIHCSPSDEVMLAVANAYYAGGDDDLVVWDVDESRAHRAGALGGARPGAPARRRRRRAVPPRLRTDRAPRRGPRATARPRAGRRAGVHRLRADRLTQPVDGGRRPHAPPEQVLAVHEAHRRRPGRRRRPDGARGTGRARTGAGRGRDGGPRPRRARRSGSARPRRRTGRPRRGGRAPTSRRSPGSSSSTAAARSARTRSAPAVGRRDRRPGAQRTEGLALRRRPLDPTAAASASRHGSTSSTASTWVDVQPQPGGRQRVGVGEPVLLVVHDDEVGRRAPTMAATSGSFVPPTAGSSGCSQKRVHRDGRDRPRPAATR